MTSNDRNLVTSKKPGTVLLMQNVDLGHTKVIQIRQRETLSHQGAIIHENCCSAAQFLFFFHHWQKYLSGLRVEDQCIISFYVFSNLKPHNSILYLECTPPVLDLWVYQRQKRIKKQPRELCSSTYFISHSISRWLSNSSFWLIIVVASFELKEVTGCPMANWQTP